MAAVDIWCRGLAGAIAAVGFRRAVFAAKGWDDYSHDLFFWARIGTFVLFGPLLGWAAAMARGCGAFS